MVEMIWWEQFPDGTTPEGSTTKKEERKKEQYPLPSEKLK